MTKVGFWTVPPEYRIQPSLLGTFFIPMGLFIFGMRVRPRTLYVIADLNLSLDCTPLCPLHSKHDRYCSQRLRYFTRHAITVHLPPLHVSKVRGEPFRRERLR